MRSPSVVWPRGLNPGALTVLVCSLLVWSLLVLAGCDSGGSPGQTSSASVTASAGPSESATLSATPTPTATPSGAYKPADASGPAQNVPVPVLPEVAKTRTKEGLEAFTRYWFELLSYGYETGDVAEISVLTNPVCAMCQQAKQVQQGWNSDGRWLAGGRITTPVVNTTYRESNGVYQVAVQVSQERLSYFNADGTLDSEDPKPADSGTLVLALFRDGAWFVDAVEPIVG
nr:DUF6318 family protein [Pseudarthrobacter sp. MEB009]